MAPVSASVEVCREAASLERLFRGDLKGSHYSFELDLSLCIWSPRSTVQRMSVPLRSFVVVEMRTLGVHTLNNERTLETDSGNYGHLNFRDKFRCLRQLANLGA